MKRYIIGENEDVKGWCVGRTYLMDGGDVFKSGYFFCKGGE